MKYSPASTKAGRPRGRANHGARGLRPAGTGADVETIQKQGGGSPPQWLSSHPNPGNRTQHINAEAAQLRVAPTPSDSGFQQTRSRLAEMAPARSMADLERNGNTGSNGEGRAPVSVGTVGQPVPAPSRQFRTVKGGELFQVSVPNNWQPISSNNSMKFVPQNGYGQANGQETMTHGTELGVAQASSRNLRQATQTLVDGFLRSNPEMRIVGQQRNVSLSGRTAIVTPLVGRSAVGGTERVDLQTTLLADGNLFDSSPCTGPRVRRLLPTF